MNRYHMRIAAAGLVVIVSVGLSACATSGPGGATSEPTAAPTAIPQDLVDAATEEGKVVVYSSLPANVWESILPSFARLYPGIAVETVDLSGADLVQRYLSEKQTGSATADLVIDGQQVTWESLKEDVADRTSTFDADLPDWAKPRDGVVAVYADPSIFFYNKLKLTGDDIPESWADLSAMGASGEYDGKLTSYVIGNDNFYSRFWTMVENEGDAAWDLLTPILKASKFEDSGGSMVQKLAQGEYVAGYFQTGVARSVVEGMGADNVIGWTYPSDTVVMSPRYSAVMNEAEHPQAAALLQDFLQSKEGQSLICQLSLNTVRSDLDSECGEYSAAAVESATENVYYVPLDDQIEADRDEFIAKFDRLRSE